MNFKYIFFLSSIICLLSCSSHEKYPGVHQLLKRLLGDKAQFFVIDSIPKENGFDIFELKSDRGKIRISASSPIAAAFAVNYYLKHFVHCFLSHSGSQLILPDQLPSVQSEVRVESPFSLHYYYNYCTYSYSMAWWGWDEWQRELDWMALNGINMPLSIIGVEAVWQNTLKKFDFTDKEIRDFIAGPAYTAWWLMGNIEGWGGPVSQQWIDNRVILQKKIVARMRELGMTPVFQGFYSMVPAKLKEKFPSHHILAGGEWGYGFTRPSTLDPADSLFNQMAAVYYVELAKLYGKTMYYGGDPFHEGGNTDHIDLKKSAIAIQGAMQKAVPGSIWVLQGWWENPRTDLLDGTDPSKTIILDLFAEGRPNWPRRDSYNHFRWIWNVLQNFGNKTGMYGRLEEIFTAPFLAMHTSKGNQLCGIGVMAEGIDNNPIIWDAIFDVGWMKQSPDIDHWVNEYSYYRYGKQNKMAEQAWDILRKTVYRGPVNQEGTIDAAVCCRPSLDISRSWQSGKTKLYYDTLQFQKALALLQDASEDLKNIDTYQYDLVDVTRQFLCNRLLSIHKQIVVAWNMKDINEFDKKTKLFLQVIIDLDQLLATRKEFLLGRWIEGFIRNATSQQEKKLFEFNARRQITLWGNQKCSEILHEYAMKQWSGLIKDFYYERWKMYFEELHNQLSGLKPKSIDFYTWEDNWTHQNKNYPIQEKGNPVEISKDLFRKYYVPENISISYNFNKKIIREEPSKDVILNTITCANIDDIYISESDIVEINIVKCELNGDTAQVMVNVKPKHKNGYEGDLELTYVWNFYEWDVTSIINLNLKKLKDE